MDTLVDTLGDGFRSSADEMRALWAEYEEATSPEALFVKDLDKYEMIVQAFEYEKRAPLSFDCLCACVC